MNYRLTLATVAFACLLGTARAQLIVGNDDTLAGATNAWHIDLVTGASTPLFTDTQAWGMCVDDLNGKIYVNDGTPLHEWAYNSGTSTVNLGNPVSTVDGASILFASLASNVATGQLFGGRNTNSTNNPEGIYTINVGVTPPQVTPFWLPGVTTYDWGGLGYHPGSGMFYMVTDTAPTGVGSGMFEIDTVGNTVTKLAAHPGGETDVDGCEVIGDKVYIVTDDAADPIYVWNITLGAYETPTLTSPMPTTEVFSSAGHAPSLFGPPVVTYCTAGTSTSGCVPSISATGTPSVSASSGFTISVANVEGVKQGRIFYGINGQVASPWGMGSSFLCVTAPTQRMTTHNSGGTLGACDGMLSEDWLAWVAANPAGLGAPFSAGNVVNAQGWYRDPPSPKTTNLSDAIEFTLVP